MPFSPGCLALLPLFDSLNCIKKTAGRIPLLLSHARPSLRLSQYGANEMLNFHFDCSLVTESCQCGTEACELISMCVLQLGWLGGPEKCHRAPFTFMTCSSLCSRTRKRGHQREQHMQRVHPHTVYLFCTLLDISQESYIWFSFFSHLLIKAAYN